MGEEQAKAETLQEVLDDVAERLARARRDGLVPADLIVVGSITNRRARLSLLAGEQVIGSASSLVAR